MFGSKTATEGAYIPGDTPAPHVNAIQKSFARKRSKMGACLLCSDLLQRGKLIIRAIKTRRRSPQTAGLSFCFLGPASRLPKGEKRSCSHRCRIRDVAWSSQNNCISAGQESGLGPRASEARGYHNARSPLFSGACSANTSPDWGGFKTLPGETCHLKQIC